MMVVIEQVIHSLNDVSKSTFSATRKRQNVLWSPEIEKMNGNCEPVPRDVLYHIAR